MKMTTEEAFVKVLQMHGIEHAFGIIGSAFMPISDLFPQGRHHILGRRARDQRRPDLRRLHALDRQDRAWRSRKTARASPNFVTAMKTAYWNHTPMLLVTPQAANRTIGQGGFQEVEQMALFRDMVCYQEEVRDPSRIAEVLEPRHLARPSACRRRRRSTSRATTGPRSSTSTCRRSSSSSVRPAAPRRSPRRPSCCRRRNSRSSCRAPASCSATRSRNASRWPRSSMRRSATTTSTTTASPAAIGSPSVRSATTARRPRWSWSPRPTWCWRSAPGSIRSRPCRATASTTGRRPPRSSRSTSTPTASA